MIGPGGSLTIVGLPFDPGELVTVRVTPATSKSEDRHSTHEIERSRQIRRSLRLTVQSYDDPFSPAVPLEDWDALKDGEP